MMYQLEAREVESDSYDVVVCGAGTAGVFAAIAAARNGARTVVIESKGYVGGIAAEGGCGLHSFYNVWKPYKTSVKKNVVCGIPEEFIQRLSAIGGASNHNETEMYYEYDSDCLCVDVEKYKYVALEMLRESGAKVMLNTHIVDAIRMDNRVKGVVTCNHGGQMCILGKCFIDATGYGDVCAFAGANFTEPNDYDVANSIGVSGIDIDKYYSFLKEYDALYEVGRGPRGDRDDQIIRVSGRWIKISPEIDVKRRRIGLSEVTTTLYDNYFMFLKINYKMSKTPTNNDALSEAEYELRKRQMEAIQLIREFIPGAEHAFITRSAPSVTIRRGRCIECDYDISCDEITNCTHFKDDIFSYGFHDSAPLLHVGEGGTYGLPLRAILVKNFQNLMAVGMMITSARDAHMSTRNTVSCMAMGQAAGTVAALYSRKDLENIRDLEYHELRSALERGNLWFPK